MKVVAEQAGWELGAVGPGLCDSRDKVHSMSQYSTILTLPGALCLRLLFANEFR